MCEKKTFELKYFITLGSFIKRTFSVALKPGTPAS